MGEKTMWGIHAGSGGEADNLFIKNKVIAIGWEHIGDLSRFKSRDEYKSKLEQYKDLSVGAQRNIAGIFYRFVYEMQIGDLVVYPSKRNKRVCIGEVKSGYKYRPDVDSEFPNQRDVAWNADFPRTRFSQQALYEIGSALSLFQVRNYADEFLAALEGTPGSEEPATGEETVEVASITEDMESQTQDFVLKQLHRHYQGEALEELIVHLLEKMGYHARQTMRNAPSVDIIAHRDEFGFEPPLIRCQVKSSDETVNLEPVEKLYSRVNQNEYGLFITLSGYNSRVTAFAEAKHNLRLIDGYELVDIILEHYDELDTKYKNTIPLNKVFLPSVAG